MEYEQVEFDVNRPRERSWRFQAGAVPSFSTSLDRLIYKACSKLNSTPITLWWGFNKAKLRRCDHPYPRWTRVSHQCPKNPTAHHHDHEKTDVQKSLPQGHQGSQSCLD